MKWDDLSRDTVGRLEGIGPRDLVVALPGCADRQAVSSAAATWSAVLSELPAAPRALLLHADPAAPADTDVAPVAHPGQIEIIYAPMTGAVRVDDVATRFSDTARSVLQIGRQLDAKAVCVFGTLPPDTAPAEIGGLLQPVLDGNADLMVPRFAAGPLDGLMTRGIVYPLVRALFGKRLHDPMAVNFASSARLAARFAGSPPRGRAHPTIWMANDAVCAGMNVGQAFTRRPEPGTEPGDLGTVFRIVLGSLFLDVEQHAAYWQRVHGSRDVPTTGAVPAASATPLPPPVDAARMVESFQQAIRSLVDVWSVLLPPASILDLAKLVRVPADEFRLPDDLWARVVYDVALGHKLRLINRDHLLGSFVSLYMAWVASWILQAGTGRDVNARQERLCVAFEQQKPYLLSRWRWPDRFSP